MHISNLALIFAALSIGFTSEIWAQNSEEKVSTSISVGLGRSQLEFQDRSGRITEARFTILDFGFNVSGERWFGSYRTELPFNQGGDTTTGTASAQDVLTQTEIHSLTVGYNVYQGLAFLGGYHYAEYDFFRLPNGLATHIDKGPFAGLAYNFAVGDTASLNFSAAYGVFDGEIGAGLGETRGFSYALAWSDAYRDDMSYFVRLKITDYRFDLDQSTDFVERKFAVLSAGITF
ncbi:MAG: hypothetical protein BMS9Abin33_1278 [Gammaproteobacteria bacterium]|nr:MAG: hypothetical protein BMS9Abin33_1278 [Gammaproteobacteria bacterium]